MTDTPTDFSSARSAPSGTTSRATTIFAWATPIGRSGVAVLRISGAAAADALAYLGVPLPSPREAKLVTLANPHTQETIDRGLAIYFKAPHSFTGEDVVEIHTHGSRAVIQELTEVLLRHPALRLAEAGEFTRRAFMNNKMDLTEAEGLADLIDAETRAQKRQALDQMEGGLSKHYERFRTLLVESLAYLEAYIDFPDEDLPDHVLPDLRARVDTLRKEILIFLDDKQVGEKIRDGFSVVILGPPNAGKSSLLNALARRDVAIVSPRAGTTRDIIEVHLDLDGLPVTLVDTAGLRETSEEIESEGIRRALLRAEHADIKIIVVDIVSISESISDVMNIADGSSILVLNKSDLEKEGCSLPQNLSKFQNRTVRVSAQKNEGLDALITLLKAEIASKTHAGFSPIITRAHHRESLTKTAQFLADFQHGGEIEILCEILRLAALEMAKITGRIHVDDVLDVVFKSFCIGK